MEEEKKIKMTEQEAKNYIIKKLRNRKIECLIKDDFREDISNENFIIEIYSGHYYSWHNDPRDYDIVNIKISTKEYYPTVRRSFKKFDVLTGDYTALAEKVKFIIQENIKMKQAQKVKEENRNSNAKILKEKLAGLGARKETYGDSYKIKNKYFTMTFWAFDDRISIDIKEPADMTIEQAIELINKLKE